MLEAVFKRRYWSPRPDSNRGPFTYQGNALPPELRGRATPSDSICCILGARLMATIDDVLRRARSRLKRLGPEEAAAELESGALLVDTRTEIQRRERGEIPGALVIDRTVLEWRLDPSTPGRIAEAADHRGPGIAICAQGSSARLAPPS